MGTPIASHAQEQQSANVDEAEDGVGVIIVTAQRRAEDLQDVPVAVTAFSGEQLAARQIDSVVDIMTTVPNLHASNNIGQGSAVTAFIRGVGETESIPTIDTPVGFYLDDVYIARQGVNNMALYDIESIEILRGPQGTLYGRNTSAGAIKVNTKKPDPSAPQFMAEASYGRFDEWRLKASANLPISANMAIRVNGIIGDDDGDTLNIFNGTRVNETSTKGARIALLSDLSNGVTVEVAGDYSRNNENGTYAIDIGGISRPTIGSLFIANTSEETRHVTESYGVMARITADIGERATLTSISAWRGSTQRYNWDLSDQPVPLYLINSDNSSDQYSQELQISGDMMDGRVSYVAGLYYFNESADAFINDFVFQSLNFTKALGVKTDSYAAFAQAGIALSDTISLIVGGRFTRDEKSIEIEQRIGGMPGFELTGDLIFDTDTVEGQIIAARPDKPVETDLGFSRFTPKVGIEFEPDEDMLLYATWTRGFKSGGWSARVFDASEFFDFAPETIDSYEVGVKSTILDGNATANLVGFYYDYKNLFNTGTTDAGGFGIATTDAEIYGIELETAWRLADGVRAFGNASWQEGKRKGVGATTITLGDELQRLPQWQFSVGVDVDQSLSDELDWLFNASYSYTDELFVNPQNTAPALTGPIDRVNASIGIAAADRSWTLTLGCRNCLGEEYIDQILDFPAFGFVAVYPGERSNWTLTGRVRF
ncbi:MAG: TonB-dependent receptor [Erythrobacter sp.]